MGRIEKVPRPGRLPTAGKSPKRISVVLCCLFVLLLVNFYQLYVVFGHDHWNKSLALRRTERAVILGLLCLPFSLWCIAELLTHGASARAGGGQNVGGSESKPGLLVVLRFFVALSSLFLIIVLGTFVIVLTGYGGELAVLSAAFVTSCAGFLGALGLADLLLRLWRFELAGSMTHRLIAALAYGFTAGCWELMLFLIGASYMAH
jgi:hypothetical protein